MILANTIVMAYIQVVICLKCKSFNITELVIVMYALYYVVEMEYSVYYIHHSTVKLIRA